MKCNVGSKDRIIRIVLGIIVIIIGIYFQSWWGLIGILILLTGIFRFCLAYIPFGFSTCNTEQK